MVKTYPKGTWVELTARLASTCFDCRCRNPECNVTLIDPANVYALDQLYVAIGGFDILSGYRCEAHNQKVGGARASYHVRGMAADIEPTKVSVKMAAEEAEKIIVYKQGGVGTYSQRGFIHVDSRPCRVRWQG